MKLLEFALPAGEPIFLDPAAVVAVTAAPNNALVSRLVVRDVGAVEVKGTAAGIVERLRGAPAKPRKSAG